MASRGPALRSGVACGAVLGFLEAAGLGLRDRLAVHEVLWLTVIAVGIYGVVAAVLLLLTRPSAAPVAVALVLLTVGSMAHARILHRRLVSRDDPEVAGVVAEGLLRLAATLLLVSAIAALLRRWRGWPGAARAATLLALLAAAAFPAGSLLLLARASAHEAGGPQQAGDGVPGGRGSGRSIVLAVIDTTRADRLGSYGNPRPLTPLLDRLARRGIVFPESLSHASWTKPETATLLSSLYPSVHGATHETAAVPSSVLMLPEVLAAAGYRTIAFSANGSVSSAFSMHQGFDEFTELTSSDPALQAVYDLTPVQFAGWVLSLPIYAPAAFGATADAMGAQVRQRLAELPSGPLFLYLHLMDPHAPYFAPAGRRLARRIPNFPGTRDAALAAYEDEIAFVDHELGCLLRWIEAHPAMRDAVVAVTSDHGEEFFDHGNISHGTTLYDEQVRVPLLLRIPGGPSGNSRATARGIDVAPTLLAAAGLPVPPSFQGDDLLVRSGDVPVFHEEDFQGRRLRALRVAGVKVIVEDAPRPGHLEMYDLTTDPAEREDLAAARPEDAERHAAELSNVAAHLRSLAREPADAAPGSERSLRSLGYLR